MKKYLVINESVSAHCCFGYSVVWRDYDDSNFDIYNLELSICETFEESDAINIAKLLNDQEENK